jgi:PiT family inorganic phosphate transporter
VELLLLVAALGVAFVNGANDNIKGVATLYGSATLSYRQALALATVSTALGSLLSLFLATGLIRAFSAKGLLPDDLLTPAVLAAVGVGAALTVLAATRFGFPISTTHALLGGLLGAGVVTAGTRLNVAALGGTFLLPLLLGPIVAAAFAGLVLQAGRRVPGRLRPEASFIDTGKDRTRAAYAHRDKREAGGVPAHMLLDAAHLASASLVGFARGLNDTPKILGLLVGASVLSPWAGTLAITLMMALGGLIASRPVAETLSKKITPMTMGEGLIGNLGTSLLVVGASRFGLPVSTTHVSTGAIFGIGTSGGEMRWRAVGSILSAWVTTLPLAAAIAALTMWALR